MFYYGAGMVRASEREPGQNGAHDDGEKADDGRNADGGLFHGAETEMDKVLASWLPAPSCTVSVTRYSPGSANT